MGRDELSTQEQHAVDTIVRHMQEYMDMRFAQSCRVNPRFEQIWPDLAWQQMRQLRNTLENKKAWGPTRFCIGALLASDDYARIHDIFNPTHQSSIQVEIVEQQEDTSKGRRAEVLEIHDFRTLYSNIDKAVATIAMVMQIFLWWDLPDAADLARFDLKMERLRKLEQGISDEMRSSYAEIMKDLDHVPTDDDILTFELRLLKKAVDRFVGRRENEPGYKVIIARKPSEGMDAVDRLIGAIAREQILLRNLEHGQELDENLKQQFSKALGVPAESLSTNMEADYIHRMIAEHKKKLRGAMTGEISGEPYDYKIAQRDAILRKSTALIGDRDLSVKEVKEE
ncbi:hypothetical protein KQI84_13560 [bacterium]|nr:hypothetical protein [bacterium]